MLSENNITTNFLTDLVHCIILLMDLTLGEHLQILVEVQGGMCKSGICDKNDSSGDEIANVNFYAVRPEYTNSLK